MDFDRGGCLVLGVVQRKAVHKKFKKHMQSLAVLFVHDRQHRSS